MPTLGDPVAFELFGLSVRWYGLFILAGIAAALAVSRVLAGRRGMDAEFLLDVAPLVLLAAIVGARVYYLLLRWDFYREHPDEIITLQLQGLTIHGALAGGVLAFWWLCRRRGQPFLAWADVVIAGVPIGQAIGRWGNWANQEAFGTPTDLPWAVRIDPVNRPAEYVAAETFHPTFLYEGVLNLVVAAVLIWLVLQIPRRPWLRDGDALWSYLVLYGLVRLPIEAVRTDSLHIGPLPAAYWLSALLILVGGAMLAWNRGLWRGAGSAHTRGIADDGLAG